MTPDCPHCGAPDAYAYKSRPIFKCRACGGQFPATTGTPWRDSKMTPDVRARVYEAVLSGAGAMEISRSTGVHYKTAWLARKKVRNAQA